MNLASEFVSKKGKEILSLKSEFESDLVLVIDQAEVVYLGMLSHPHLVKLVGFCNQDDHRMLVYEYMPRGSLENHLFKNLLASLPWSTRLKIAVGAAKGLAFLHEAETPVIYRDFKASNILLDSVSFFFTSSNPSFFIPTINS